MQAPRETSVQALRTLDLREDCAWTDAKHVTSSTELLARFHMACAHDAAAIWHSSRVFVSAYPENSMRYQIAPLFCRPWTLNGMSPRLIESHYEHNYGGALSRLNSVTSELEALDVKTTSAPVISRLSREQTTLLNSTLLHELYFASLGGDGRNLPDTIASALARDFGS